MRRAAPHAGVAVAALCLTAVLALTACGSGPAVTAAPDGSSTPVSTEAATSSAAGTAVVATSAVGTATSSTAAPGTPLAGTRPGPARVAGSHSAAAPAGSARPARAVSGQASGGTPVAARTTTPVSTGTPRQAGAVRSGFATYYGDAQPGGACMTQTVPASLYTAAISHVDWAGSSLCQAYLSVTGPKGTILVKADNECPDADCPTGHLDLSTEAFAAIGQLSQGVIPITWHIVENPPITGDILLTVKDGSNPYWLGLHIDNTGNAIATVTEATGNATLTPMTRSNSGFFVSTSPGPGPYRIRITDVYGHTVTAAGISAQVGLTQHTGQRLY